MSSRRGYPVIGGPLDGGPLDGDLATEADFRQERRAVRDIGRYKVGDLIAAGGRLGPWASEYVGYNRADSRAKVPTRIWLHKSWFA